MAARLRAIETRYHGYRFRSRLEARWAVFFDVLGLPYSYEPEGVDLGGEWYLPDFKLTHGVMACPCGESARDALGWDGREDYCWAEVKPAGVRVEERTTRSLSLLARSSGQPAYLLCGEPYHGSYTASVAPGVGEAWGKRLQWSECPVCGTVALQRDGGVYGVAYGSPTEDDGSGAPMFYCGHCDVHAHGSRATAAYWHKGFWVVTRAGWAPSSGPRLNRAFLAARGARFEHGESGASR